jgi:hypothetical protein
MIGLNSPSPFLVVPWETGFLQGLLRLALTETGENIARAEFIFPHSRPKRYLSLLLSREESVRRPLLMPRIHTISSLFAAISGRILSRPAWNAGLLDRVGLLLNCVREEADRDDSPFLAEARTFFPWGVRLAARFVECFSQHRKPGNFLHMEAQASPFAAMLLSRLGHIYSRYETALREREWTSPGFDASLTADHLQIHDSLPDGIFSGTTRLYIAGFHALSRSENFLFRHLWERKAARIVIHADPALTEDSTVVHWSCRAFLDWAKNWKAVLEPLPERDGREMKRRIRYYAGFDLHSQLAVLAGELPEDGLLSPADKTATPKNDSPPPEEKEFSADRTVPDDMWADTVLVLPDSALLMPVLHHLPHVDVNISMGYPLSRSPLFRLIETLIRLQEGRKRNGYYWRDLVDLIRHPYVKMLRPVEQEENGSENPATAGAGEENPLSPSAPSELLRRELHRLERALREHGRRYADPFSLLAELYQMLPPEEVPPAPVLALLEELLKTTLTDFENPSRLKDLAVSLEKLCLFLVTHGRSLWRRFPIDAECLYRLRQSLIPELALSIPSGELFPPDTLFAIFRSLFQAERVPFEAEPLVGLQIMGMLETRLLSFRRVIIIDAGEDSLPGFPEGDPLLPEMLRPELGLPSLHSREQVAAYTFFRLAAGAEEIVLLWQEGGDAPGIREQKKKKSRFVEELLWEEEKNLGRLLRPKGKDGPLTVLSSAVTPLPRTRKSVAVSPPVRRLLLELQKKPVSASLLDSYLRCPARFFHERLVRLSPAEEVLEGDDPLAVGNLFHQALLEAYGCRLAQPLPGGEALSEEMGPELLESLFASPVFLSLSRKLSADSLAMLICSAEKRLSEFLSGQLPTRVLALETPLRAAFSREGRDWQLIGKADRIDARSLSPEGMYAAEEETPGENGAGIVILDYKTGRVPAVSSDVWEDETLWRHIAQWQPQPGGEHAPDPLLTALSGRMESVQLPFYLLLYSLAAAQNTLPPLGNGDSPPALPLLDARWVALGDKGEEISLFPKKFSLRQRRLAVEQQIPSLVHFLLRHMLESPVLAPVPGKHCDWCSSEKLCTLTSADV